MKGMVCRGHVFSSNYDLILAQFKITKALHDIV